MSTPETPARAPATPSPPSSEAPAPGAGRSTGAPAPSSSSTAPSAPTVPPAAAPAAGPGPAIAAPGSGGTATPAAPTSPTARPTPPSAPSPAAASPPAAAPAVPPPPLTGTVSDRGAVRHDELRTLEWTVEGASKVLGSAEAGFAHLHGMVTIGRALTAVDLGARGTLTVEGTARLTGRLRLTGTGRFLSGLRAAALTADGRLEVAGDLEVTDEAVVGGITEVGGALRAGTLTFSGEFRVAGPVSAGAVTGTLEGRCRTGPIRAASIAIGRPVGAPWKSPGRLTTLRIEADTAYLTGVTVAYLRADAVHLGPDCRVARLEGRLVERHRSARVGPSSISEPPPGISR